jgi:hypothetical protein
MYGLSLFLDDDWVVMFLMAIFFSNLSLFLTCVSGGITTGDEYVMLLYSANVSGNERARKSASSFP